MGVNVRLGPDISETIEIKLQSIDAEGLDAEIKTRLIRNVIRGISYFTVLFESRPEIFVSYWLEAIEAEDFDMSLDGRDIVSKMIGSSFLAGCHELGLNLQGRVAIGLVPEFGTSNAVNKKNPQYEFLTQAWKVAGETFVACQK